MPTVWLAPVAAVFGLAIGSFMTVVAARVPAGESVVAPRSRCPRCGATIRTRDNIPVLSWLLLRGRCRDCRERIPARYPILEVSTAILMAAPFFVYESVWVGIFFRQCSILLPALAVPFLPGASARREVRVAACFGLAACLPFLIRQQQYYFLNVCPWLFLLFAMGAEQLSASAKARRPVVSLAAALLLLAMPIRGAAAEAEWLSAETRSEQIRRARLMTLAWPASQPTLVLALPSFVHLTRYPSPDEPVLGYRFINEHTPAQLVRGFERASGVWVDPRGMYARQTDGVLRTAGTSLDEQLARNGFRKQLVVEDRFELWTKQPPPER